MKQEIVYDCPLGSQCEEIKDNKIHRCIWFTKIAGKMPDSEETVDEWRCAMSWLPFLMVETSMTNRGQTSAIESMRNEMVKGQNTFNSILLNASKDNKNKLE